MRVTHGADYTYDFEDLRLALWRLRGRGSTARYRLVLTRRTRGRPRGERYRNYFREEDFRDLGHMVAGLYWSLAEIFPRGRHGARAAALLDDDAPVTTGASAHPPAAPRRAPRRAARRVLRPHPRTASPDS